MDVHSVGSRHTLGDVHAVVHVVVAINDGGMSQSNNAYETNESKGTNRFHHVDFSVYF